MHNKKDGPECYELGDLGLAEIREIIKDYAGVPDDAVDELALACMPSPRYAHRMAKIVASGTGGLPGLSLGADATHERHIGAGLGPYDGEQARKRKSVLLLFSLFTRVGHEGPRYAEYEFLRKKCAQNAGIAPGEFDTIVHELRGLGILRGHGELHIVPRMLHFWLWSEWWRMRGRDCPSPEEPLPLDDGDSGTPDALKRAFREMVDGDPRCQDRPR